MRRIGADDGVHPRARAYRRAVAPGPATAIEGPTRPPRPFRKVPEVECLPRPTDRAPDATSDRPAVAEVVSEYAGSYANSARPWVERWRETR